MKKKCKVCKKRKSLSKFENKKNGNGNYYRANNCKFCRNLRLSAKRYGIDVQDVKYLSKKQDYACAICKTKTYLNIDHCHTTGKVRGLLCKECNIGLGRFKDSTKLMSRAITYLKFYGE